VEDRGSDRGGEGHRTVPAQASHYPETLYRSDRLSTTYLCSHLMDF
jgi:hypothetical protein